jgi:hypothetical protein
MTPLFSGLNNKSSKKPAEDFACYLLYAGFLRGLKSFDSEDVGDMFF